VALALTAYLPAITEGGFVWDDDDYVTENRALRSSRGLVEIWTRPGATVQYYPLTFTTFWLEYRLWGLDPRGHHTVNVLLHALVGVLMFLLLRRLEVPGAWLACAVFVVHPVHAESVAWITERKNVLSGALYMASLLCWVRGLGLDRGDHRTRSPLHAAAGATCFLGALLSKTVTGTLPVTLALLVWWKRGRVGAAAATYVVAMLVAGALMGSLTSFLERHEVGALGEEWSLDPSERVVLAGRAWWFYLAKFAWPDGLMFVYPRWDLAAAGAGGLVWPLAALGALLLTWGLRRRFGAGPAVALLHYTVALGPALGFFNVYPMRFSFVADHFQYLAGAGPLALVMAAGVRALARRRGRGGRLAQLLGLATLALLGTLTWQRARVFGDEATLWEDTLAKNPAAWIAHHNLGSIRLAQGRAADAEAHFLKVVELKPDHVPSRTNLGVLYLREATALAREGQAETARARLAAAERFVDEGLRLAPGDFNAWANLGDVRLARADPAGAEEAYLRAIRLAPIHPHARAGLGRIRMAQGRYEDAAHQFRIVLRAHPDDPEVLYGLATALAHLGRLDEAVGCYARVVERQPANVDALYNLGTLLARAGRLREAERHLAEALRLAPAHDNARQNLARTRELLGEEKPP
jgi:tetratricopeptide (TPR) repeat protein